MTCFPSLQMGGGEQLLTNSRDGRLTHGVNLLIEDDVEKWAVDNEVYFYGQALERDLLLGLSHLCMRMCSEQN